MSRTNRAAASISMVVVAAVVSACSGTPSATFTPGEPVPVADGRIIVDFERPLATVSPLIRGVSGSIEDFDGTGVTLNSWGGERASRYNFQLGNAWNLGRAGAYRNDGVASTDDLVGDWLDANVAAGVQSRVAVPGLGWVAADRRPTTCSFPDADGACRTVETSACDRSGVRADPTLANVGSSPRTVAEWIAGYDRRTVGIDYLAVDNEPERWGVEHYDVHPSCTSYEEVLGVYSAYASSLRVAAPEAQLTGPVMCCWFGYDDAPGPPDPGPTDGSDDNLLGWFLHSLSEREDPSTPEQLIDVVDVHFRPRADVVNSRDDADANAARLAAVRELWDPSFLVQELEQPAASTTSTSSPEDAGPVAVEFIPRVRAIVDEHYPGLPLMISDWAFGNTESMNGGLAVAQALGVFSREGVHAATHADTIDPFTPGWYAFKMFGNYDDRGGAFEGTAYEVGVQQLPRIEAYAALGDDDVLRLLVVNSGDEATSRVAVDLGRIGVVGKASTYSYSASSSNSASTERSTVDIAAGEVADIPPASITMVAVGIERSTGGG